MIQPVTRFAPSPTGELHLGHALSALFAADQGRFTLRIEDIDHSRSRADFIDGIYKDLAWLGLSWPTPVRLQSEHMADYKQALARLSGMGLLYPCFCTRADIAAAQNAPQGPDGPLYLGICRHLGKGEIEERMASGQPFALRLDMKTACAMAGTLVWRDLDAGITKARPEIFGDAVLARKDIPTSYHLSVTVDDALQGIDLVTRGQDLFLATHIHRLLQALLDLPVPLWRHHHLLFGQDGKKLAKSAGSPALRLLREKGEKPEDIRRRLGF